MKVKALVSLIALVAAPVAAPAATIIFDEDFAEEAAAIAPSIQSTNFAALDSFTILDGTVDLFANGGFGLPCPSGGCLDLDGSRGNAVEMETAPLALMGGVTYTLSMNIRGNARNSADDTLIYGLRGAQFSAFEQITLAGNEDYRIVSFTTTPSVDLAASIFFNHAGGDNVGLLLDRVTLTTEDGPGVTPIPLPAPALLLMGGLTALGALRARRA